jgi:hypothetical protein
MGSLISQIDTYIQDIFNYGLMTKCPNCNTRTILSYPSTVCTHCKNRFRNDIVAVDVYTYRGHYGYQTQITKYGTSNKLTFVK